MKLKSLILGSVAAAGLSTAGFAADLGVLTSLDVCDELGLSGLTISSDTNCLQISGEVKYEFSWGNYDESVVLGDTHRGVNDITINDPSALVGGSNQDWESKVESWLKFVGTAGSDFGPASVVIKIKDVQHKVAVNGAGVLPGKAPLPGYAPVQGIGGDDTFGPIFDEAYVQVGDATVLTAGKAGSIFNKGDDEPFNFTGLFISSEIDAGVADAGDYGVETGGHVIQLWTNIGEGLIAKIGLEALDKAGNNGGTLVGVLDYAGSGITAHVSAAAGGLLDGVQNAGDDYAVHAGFTGTFDQFKLRAAIGAGGNAFVNDSYWNALISGEATFDMFKVALSAEASNVTIAGVADDADYGFGASFGATVSDGIEINIGGRYFNDGTAGEGDTYQVAAQLVAALTETVKLTTEIGVYGHAEDTAAAPGGALPAYSDFYGKAELAWNPGGGFSSSVGATVQQNGAYKVTFKAAKAFQ